MEIVILHYSTVDLLMFQSPGIWFYISKTRVMPFSPFFNKEKLFADFSAIRNTAADNNAIIITMVQMHNFASFSRGLLFCTFVDVDILRLIPPLVCKIRNQMILIYFRKGRK